jgi:hypothetical protein
MVHFDCPNCGKTVKRGFCDYLIGGYETKTICLSVFLCTVVAVPCLGQIRGVQRGSAEHAQILQDHNRQLQEEAAAWRTAKKLTLLHEIPKDPPVQRTDPESLEVGVLGHLEYWHMTVLQVIGPRDALLAFGTPRFPTLWLEDYPTTGLADRDSVRLVGLVEVTGTKTYTSASGAPRTVRTVRLVTPERQAELDAAKAAKEAAKKAQQYAIEAAKKAKLDAIEAAKRRTWTSADGRFDVAAKYLSYIGGVVTLERDDGQTISVRIEQLSEDDQGFIRERRWLEEATAPEQSQTSGNRAMPASRFVGRWRLVNDKGVAAAYFTLTPSRRAKKDHVPDATATWEIVGNDGRITWSDGWRDVLRAQEDETIVITFRPGTSWDDPPHNTLRAIRE